MQLSMLDRNELDSMSVEPDWKCNGCGARFHAPEHCPTCDTAQCPKCKRTYSLMNVKEFHRAIERDQLMLPKKQGAKRGTQTKSSKPKLPTKLMEELGISELPKGKAQTKNN